MRKQISEHKACEVLCCTIGDSGQQEMEVRGVTLISCLPVVLPQHGHDTNCPSAAPRQKTVARRPHNGVLLQPEMDHAEEMDRKKTLCGLKDLSVPRFLQLFFL